MQWLSLQSRILVLGLVLYGDRFSASVWIGEEYWTTVHYDGSLESSRSLSDLLHFPQATPNAAGQQQQSFVAYWISTNETGTPDGRYAAFGHAFLRGNPEDPEICARFMGPAQENRQICGGFRVLSLKKDSNEKNPFSFVKSAVANENRAVDYLDVQVSRISPAEARDEQGQPVFAGQPELMQPFFGGAMLRQRTAYGVHADGSAIQISYKAKPASYIQMVEILEMKFPPLPIPLPTPLQFSNNGVEEWRASKQHFAPNRIVHTQQPEEQQKVDQVEDDRSTGRLQQEERLEPELEEQQEVTLLPTTTEETTTIEEEIITTTTSTRSLPSSTTTSSSTTSQKPTTTTTPIQTEEEPKKNRISNVRPTVYHRAPPSTTTASIVNGGGFVWRRTTTNEPATPPEDLDGVLLPVHEDTAVRDPEWAVRLLLRRKKRLQAKKMRKRI